MPTGSISARTSRTSPCTRCHPRTAACWSDGWPAWIALQGGASFGFDTTRIYLAAAQAERGTPFVRIAAGTEHRLQVEALADALAVAIEACA